MSRSPWLWFVWAWVVAPAVSAGADDEVKPTLPTDEAAAARIKALKPNQAALIGEAKVVGEFNETARKFDLHKTGPAGRDYSIKMVWAPERRRALFCGANHAVPHRLNDVWEFDLSALTWVLLYAPDNPRDYTGLGKDFSDVEFRDGILYTKRGGPAVIGHTWWGLTYDPERKALFFLNTWVTDRKKAVASVGGEPAQLYNGPPLWSFTPQTGRWAAHKAEKPFPRAIFGGLMEYVPELKGPVWHANNWEMRATWVYDPATDTWRDLKANTSPTAPPGDFEKQAPDAEQVGYYDPARKLIVAQRYKETFHFDVAALAWKKVLSFDKDSDRVPLGHDAHSPMCHDSVGGRGLLVEFKTNTVWSYDPDKPEWTRLKPEGDPLPEGGKRLAYFDPAHGVLVVIRGTKVWAYRPPGRG
jgi:hypothetical protein